MEGLTRRHFVTRTAQLTGLLAAPALAPKLWAADDLAPLNRFPRMMQEYFVERVKERERKRLERLYSLSGEADARAYVQDVRARIKSCFGPEPDRTPLNPRITGVIGRESYRIENVVFESRPGFLVTANLYIPNETNDRPYPRPGVIGTCGHSSNGKAAEAYQSFAQGLARQGYVVFIYDPIGQGERLQYPDENLKSRVGVGVREHLYAGNQQFLIGEFFGMWRAWDGIRALDYLLTRPEVDPSHLGVTGNSGGGTLTTWLAGLETRFTMAAPSCFVTSFRRNLENELPADTEQCPPKALALGLDHEDFLAAMAPKPVIILAKERDYFDVRGSEAALERLKHLYRLLGAEDQIALFTGPTTHGFSQENREAMYGWFNRITGSAVGSKEPPIQLEQDATLYCAPQGQVATLASRTVFEFTKERAEQLRQQRPSHTANSLRQSVRQSLKLAEPQSVPSYRILRARNRRQFPTARFTTYAVETEPGVHTLTYLLTTDSHASRPPRGRTQAVLYVSNLSADKELRNNKTVRNLYRPDSKTAFYACDVRGTGESQPDTCGENSFLSPYGSDYFYAAHGLMLDDPYPAQKVRDLIAVYRWLLAQGHQSIHLIANGRGTIPAALAALLNPLIKQVTLIDPLASFESIASSESYSWPLSSLIPGVLEHFDLPDVYEVLRSERTLTFIQS